ncbi:MAG: putative ABC transporter permease [Aminipila sp.]
MKNICKYIILFIIGGIGYCLIEIMFRHYTYISMFVVGGVCFILVGLINNLLSFDTPMSLQMLIGGGLITAVEFISGCVLNLIFGLNIWNYSDMPFNVMGQICLPFSAMWILLSGVAIIADDYLRYWLFGEEKPHYKF